MTLSFEVDFFGVLTFLGVDFWTDGETAVGAHFHGRGDGSIGEGAAESDVHSRQR